MASHGTRTSTVGSEQAAGLYIHIPFCSSICPYCDFAVQLGNAEDRARLVRSIVREVELYRDFDHPIDTIYFGGGTPSDLAPEQLRELLRAAREHFDVTPDAWTFLEANPEDVSREAALAWRELGVDTLSLGVQSFDAEELRYLGRKHGPEVATDSIRTALEAGFPTVSADLIYGLPGQDLEAWSRNLSAAAALGPHHLSCYQLTVKDDTAFARKRASGRLVELSDESQADFFELTHHSLGDYGYEAYEVSNFARSSGHRSRHNQKYWYHVPYLGLGPAAHSYRGAERWWNERDFAVYRRRLEEGERPVAGRERLTDRDLALEALMLRLRTRAGIDLVEFEERYGVRLLERNERLVASGVEAGHMVRSGDRLVLTTAGLAIVDALAASFEID